MRHGARVRVKEGFRIAGRFEKKPRRDRRRNDAGQTRRRSPRVRQHAANVCGKVSQFRFDKDHFPHSLLVKNQSGCKMRARFLVQEQGMWPEPLNE
jgi:hypothetical protein